MGSMHITVHDQLELHENVCTLGA